VRRAILLLAGLGGATLLAACTPAWQLYEASAYRVFRTPGPEAFAAHAHLLGRVIDQAESRGERPPPGICAERAFHLWRLGRIEEAVAVLEKEERYYPESKVFVAAQKRFISGGASAIAPEVTR
jgi:hypothetical protein